MRTVPVSTEDDEFFTGNRLFTLVLSSSDSLVQIVNGTASINITEDGESHLFLFSCDYHHHDESETRPNCVPN